MGDVGRIIQIFSQSRVKHAMMKKTLTQLLTTTETLKETILDQSLNSIKDAYLQTNITSIPSLLLSTQNLLAKYDSQDDDQDDPFRDPSPCHSEYTPWILERSPSLDRMRNLSTGKNVLIIDLRQKNGKFKKVLTQFVYF